MKQKFLPSQGSQFSSVAQSCPTLCDPMNRSTPGLPVHHQLLEFTQTHIYWVGDAIQPSHPLSPPSPLALNLSQHQSLFQWVSSLHQVAKLLGLQLQHQSFQWKSYGFLCTQVHTHKYPSFLEIGNAHFSLCMVNFLSKESLLRIWWPTYWSFSFSISPSDKYSGLISFRNCWY